MGILPRKTADLLVFCQQHTQPWTDNAAGIGLTALQASGFSSATSNLAAKLQAQAAAELAFRTAVQDAQLAARDLRANAGDCLRLIKAYAENQPKPATVYLLAEIPPPATPSPLPAPGTPFDFRVALDQTGRVQLSWKCSNPVGATGTVYLVERRINGAGDFGFAAAVGEKRFTDSAIPPGTSQVDYRVVAQRSDAVGLPAVWTVRFGMGGGGLTITQQFAGGESARLAA